MLVAWALCCWAAVARAGELVYMRVLQVCSSRWRGLFTAWSLLLTLAARSFFFKKFNSRRTCAMPLR